MCSPIGKVTVVTGKDGGMQSNGIDSGKETVVKGKDDDEQFSDADVHHDILWVVWVVAR